jgi:hypothetical protein
MTNILDLDFEENLYETLNSYEDSNQNEKFSSLFPYAIKPKGIHLFRSAKSEDSHGNKLISDVVFNFSSSHLFPVCAELHLAKSGDVTASNCMKGGRQRQCN